MREMAVQLDEAHQKMVYAELRQILSSRPFAGSPRLQEFLQYCVERTVGGDFADLKEVCIGMHVFGKPPSYDPKSEPIVRVEARRLRARLEEYYTSTGVAGPPRIYLPKGGYLAQFDFSGAQSADLEPEVALSVATLLPVESQQTSVSPGSLSASLHPSPRSGSTRLVMWGVAAAAFLAGVGAALLPRLTWPKPLAFSRIAPLANDSGSEFQPAISHDGKQIAYSKLGNGNNYDVYVRLLDVGTAIRLTTDAAQDLNPQWSPDDRFLAFMRVSVDSVAVYVIPALGGFARKVTDIHLPSEWERDALQGQMDIALAWTADGKALIVTDQDEAPRSGHALFEVPLDGSGRRQLTFPGALVYDTKAAVSHGGRYVAFARDTTNSSSDIFVARADGSGLRQLTFDKMRIRGLVWGPDDRSLIFASNRGGADGLWQIPLEGGEPAILQTKGDEVANPTLSTDGTALAYTAISHNSNIWRVPLGVEHPRPELLIASNGRNDSARYSPDGRKIVFVSDRTGSWELWASDTDGHNLQQLTNFNGPRVGTPHWSPDSRYIAFDARPNGRSEIYVVGLDGSAPIKVVDDGFEDKKPSWSKDGRFLHYTSNRGGKSQLWRCDTKGRNPAQLTQIVSNDSEESLDGKTIYFLGDGKGLFTMPAAGGSPTFISSLASVPASRYFDVLEHLYYLRQTGQHNEIVEYDTGNGKSVTLASFPGLIVYGTPSLSVSPDHRYAIYAIEDKLSSEIITEKR